MYKHYYFGAQNSGFLIYAWNALGGGVGGKSLPLLWQPRSLYTQNGTTCYLRANIPIDEYHSHVSIL